jgi:mRNA interferase MazF
MATRVNRGEIWFYTFKPPNKQRPVLVLSRQDVIPYLRSVIVAPITSTIRGAPAEVIVGIGEGLKRDSAINLDHVQSVEQRLLRRYIGTLGREKVIAVCRALAVATGCDDTVPIGETDGASGTR